MSLEKYFDSLITRVESSELDNQGKDDKGFFLPTRTAVLQNLRLLKDLHQKPGAKGMVKTAWKFVSEHLPAEWLVLDPEQKAELKKVLS